MPYRQASPDIFLNGKSIVTFKTVQLLGQALSTHDDKLAAKLQQAIERSFPNSSEAKYEIVRVQLGDPLIRGKRKPKGQKSEVVGVFSVYSNPISGQNATAGVQALR